MVVLFFGNITNSAHLKKTPIWWRINIIGNVSQRIARMRHNCVWCLTYILINCIAIFKYGILHSSNNITFYFVSQHFITLLIFVYIEKNTKLKQVPRYFPKLYRMVAYLHISVFHNSTFLDIELACNLFPSRFWFWFLAITEVRPNLTSSSANKYKGFSKFIKGIFFGQVS